MLKKGMVADEKRWTLMSEGTTPDVSETGSEHETVEKRNTHKRVSSSRLA